MTTKPRATALDRALAPQKARRGMFVLEDGRNVLFTFFLLIFLFALWGFCNGMIDVMDKHFQEELHLNLAQSAWVQFAHYLGYFLMALPAGWLATKLGYKGGIITGLLMVAVGRILVYPGDAHRCSSGRFLLGVCIIAAGLTFLETIANPYTTVLGPPQYAATRINLAQSCNGIGLLLGPIAGGMFFYSKNAAGESTGSETALDSVRLHRSASSSFSRSSSTSPTCPISRWRTTTISTIATPDVSHSIWSHPHFGMAVLAQFLYVAAQAGIFSFFINYMTSQVPPIPAFVAAARRSGLRILRGWFETHAKRRAWLQQQRRVESRLARLSLLPGRPLHRRAILKKFAAQQVLGLYSAAAVALCLLDLLKARLGLGGLRLPELLLHVDHVPDDLRARNFRPRQAAKKASSFIVMAIMGGAILPKLMGAVADNTICRAASSCRCSASPSWPLMASCGRG